MQQNLRGLPACIFFCCVDSFSPKSMETAEITYRKAMAHTQNFRSRKNSEVSSFRIHNNNFNGA